MRYQLITVFRFVACCVSLSVLLPIAFLVVLLGACCDARGDDLPRGVRNSQNPSDVSLSPRDSLEKMEVPDGFHVTLFAGEPNVRRPIAFDFDDRGRLWVAENYAHPDWKPGEGPDRIVILEDRDNDGTHDHRKVFWQGGRYLSGLAWGHGGVWIGNAPELSFIPDRDRDDTPDGPPIVKLDGFQVTRNNMLNNFHWGPDGWLYGAIGFRETGRIGPPDSTAANRVPMTRGIWRYHPTREVFEKVATGMVNPWGADFNQFGDLITSNTVIAHLWHIVPGMHAQRRASDIEDPHVYEYIQSIADHLHWGGGRWQDSRVTTHQHSVSGGGHAHCGGMIYLGDNWPNEYHGTFFTGNLHGNRLNNDLLTRRGATYVATHRPDFLFAHDPWFRSLTQKYGPDGGVFVSDWHDFGECHDQDGSHRTSGRIYKVIFGEPRPCQPLGLHSLDASGLVKLHEEKNEWFVRRARRILQERGNNDSTTELLMEGFAQASTIEKKLRYAWTLFATDSLSEEQLIGWTNSQEQQLRRWAVRFLVDRAKPLGGNSPWTPSNSNPPNDSVIQVLERLASDSSPIVRLAVASALQRVPARQRLKTLQTLVQNEQDQNDPYLPLFIWYASEPLAKVATPELLDLMQNAKLATVIRLIARRVADLPPDGLDLILARLEESQSVPVQREILQGILASVKLRPPAAMPYRWSRIAGSFDDPSLTPLVTQLAVHLGDPEMKSALRRRLQNRSLAESERLDALRTLFRIPGGVTSNDLLNQLASQRILRAAAIRMLRSHASRQVAQRLVKLFSSLSQQERSDAIATMTGHAESAEVLMQAVRDGVIAAGEVSAYAIHSLRTLPNAELSDQIDELFGTLPSASVAKQIAEYKQQLTSKYLASADLPAGRRLFDATCAKCHRLYENGNDFGPDLTGSGRKDLDYLLSNLMDPSGLIDPSFRVTNLVTVDGRISTGFLVNHDERNVSLRTPDGIVTVRHADVELLETSDQSMMPEGLLHTYSMEETRDLIAYLMSADDVRADGEHADGEHADGEHADGGHADGVGADEHGGEQAEDS